MNGSLVRVLVSLCGMTLGGICLGQQTSTWLNPIDGKWSDPINWSGGVVPNNSGLSTFRAEILVPGNYQVVLDMDATVSGFSLAAPGSRLVLAGNGRTFNTTGTNLFDGADITGFGNSTAVSVGGNTVVQGGVHVANVSGLRFSGIVGFSGNNDFDLCDTDIYIQGEGSWSGSGGFVLEGVSSSSRVVVEQGGSLTLTGTGDRKIDGQNTLNRFINRGEVSVQLASSDDTFDIDSALMINEAGGRINVSRGKVRSNAFGSALLGKLTGGDWSVGNDGTVDLEGIQLNELAVRVDLSGANSSFAAVDSVNTVLAEGTLSISDGRNFVTDSSAARFDVQGGLEVGAGSTMLVSTSLGNIDGSALRGGRFVVGGNLELSNGEITSLGADLVLEGSGSIRSAKGGENLLAGLDRVESAGSFELKGGADFVTAGDLAMDGALRVGSGSVFEVSGDLGAFQNGVLVGGEIVVGGDVIADNTLLERVSGRLIVGLSGRLLKNDDGGMVNGLLSLQRIEAGGLFGLAGGRELDLTSVSNTVEIAGTLSLGWSGLEDGPGNTGSLLRTDAVVHEAGSVLSVGIGGVDDYGRIEADLVRFGAGDEDSTAGELVLELSSEYVAAFGDEFLILGISPAGSVLGAGFASLNVDGALGGGLFFEQFISSDGLGVRVVPSPGTGPALLVGLTALRRRRA